MSSTRHHAADTAPAAIERLSIAAAVRRAVAGQMQIKEPLVDEAMARSSWGNIEEMIAREFSGTYRGYCPKCGMAIRDEAVIAEAFDLLAIAFEDPRRALRHGAWSPPAAPASRVSRACLQARSLIDHWYASGPEGVPFHPGHPDFTTHHIVEDNPTLPHVVVQNDGGQRFELEREFARSIALAPIRF